jgi:glycosyltransferase involved in cell wall biosynthesis
LNTADEIAIASVPGVVDEPAGLTVYVLAKNERANIGRSLDALARHRLPVKVMDSGSTDGTQDLARTYPAVEVVPYRYENHCAAYNQFCGDAPAASYVMVLDADMIVTDALMAEVAELMKRGVSVIQAPVRMYVEGEPLVRGSLYPPKPIIFRGASTYFVPTGHGERLRPDCGAVQTNAELIHDDRKPYTTYLQSQARYAENLVARADAGHLSQRDRMRVNTPLMLLLVPLVSYILKLGVLSGRAGLVYAMDRLIAEAIMFRQALAARIAATRRGGEKR